MMTCKLGIREKIPEYTLILTVILAKWLRLTTIDIDPEIPPVSDTKYSKYSLI